jgi:3-oxoadipate enol-lactonase
MSYLQANGLNIYYERLGGGEPILLLHGFGGTGRSDWRHQIPVFSQSYEVIVPDLRGHGRTDHPETITGPEFFQEATSDMVSLVSSLDLGPIHLCGFSMGVSIASWLYSSDPSLVRSLILVSGAARVNREIAPGLFHLWESLHDPDVIDAGWATVLAHLHGEDKWRLLVRNYGAAVLARVENDEDIAYGRAGEITCPVLIIQGSEDTISPPLLSQELHARIPDSELVMLESEHWVPGLRAEELNETVLGFLARRANRGTLAEGPRGAVG